jgi:hypothetical protein
LTFLLLAATGLATRALARLALDDGAATLAGCAALFSGYALFTSYERSAFGELSGGLWLPLLLLLILRDRSPSCDVSSRSVWRCALDGSTVPLALVVAGAWFSNAPVGVMACYLLAAVAPCVAVLKRSWAPVVCAALGMALGIGLAAIYLVPAAWEQRWVDIRQTTDDPGERIENSWLFARHSSQLLELHDIELLRVSLIAVTMIAVTVAGLFVLWRRGKLETKRSWWIPLALIPAAVLFLLLPVSLPVWNLLPKLRFLQFPWRWLAVLEAPMGIFFAWAVWLSGRWRVIVAAVCTVLFLASSAVAGAVFFQKCDDEDAVWGIVDQYWTGGGFAGTDEYAPRGADDSLLATGLPAACLVSDPLTVLGEGADDIIPAWDADQGSCEATFPALRTQPEQMRISASTGHQGYLILRLRSYPAWRVTVNGRLATELPQRADGLMVVPLPAGAVSVAVDWTTTRDVVIGRWLSGFALVLLVVLYFIEQKLSRPRVS